MTQEYPDKVEVHRIDDGTTGYQVIAVVDGLPTAKYAFLTLDQCGCEVEGDLSNRDAEFVVYLGGELDAEKASSASAGQIPGVVLKALERHDVSVLCGVSRHVGVADWSGKMPAIAGAQTVDVRGATPLRCPDIGCHLYPAADPWTDQPNVEVLDVIPRESSGDRLSPGGSNCRNESMEGPSQLRELPEQR